MAPSYFYILFYVYVFAIPISSTVSVQRASPGDTVTLMCPVRKETSPIQWEKHLVIYSQDSQINPNLDGRIRIRIQTVGNHRDGYFDLQIINTTHEDSGIYTCTTKKNGTGVSKNTQLMIIDRFSTNENNKTSSIIITDSFTTIDQMDKGSHQENTSGITRREIILCCALAFMLLLTVFLFARNRHYTIRKIGISDQQNDRTPTDQESTFVETIHLYSTADDNSVHLVPININRSIQADDNVSESNSSISSSRDFNVEEDYIHPYDILVHISQDDNHEYEKLDNSGENYTSRIHDRIEDKRTSTEIIISSITPEGVEIGHEDIVKSSSLKVDSIGRKYTTDKHEAIANIKTFDDSSNCVHHDTIHVVDNISLD